MGTGRGVGQGEEYKERVGEGIEWSGGGVRIKERGWPCRGSRYEDGQ